MRIAGINLGKYLEETLASHAIGHLRAVIIVSHHFQRLANKERKFPATMANSYQERFLKLSFKCSPKVEKKTFSKWCACVRFNSLSIYIFMKNVFTAYSVAVIIVTKNTSRLYNVQT